MSLCKLTMFINVATGDQSNPAAIRVGGWSFSVYETSIINPSRKAEFRRLCQAYAGLLPSTGVVVAQRYQDLDPLGPSGVELMRFPGVAGSDNDYPSMALYCRTAGTGVANTRPLYIRGIPDAMIVKGEFVPTAAYTRALETFKGEMEGWNFRARDKSAPAVPVVSIGTDKFVTTETPLTGVVVGSMVRLLRYTPYDSRADLKKVYKVKTVTTESFFELDGFPTNGAGEGGSIRLNAYTYPNIPSGGVTVGRIVSKKPGRPFDLFRGRAAKHR